MKKTIAVLAGIFVLFLCVGIWFNFQQGFFFDESFWRVRRDGSVASGYGDRIMPLHDGGFELDFSDAKLHVRAQWVSDEVCQITFSDGVAVEIRQRSDIPVEAGGFLLGADVEYIIMDANAGNWRFAPAGSTETGEIFDENNRVIGEYTHILTAEGETIDYREDFYDFPELSSPKKESLVFHNGMRLTESDISSKLLVNDEGEYLIDSHRVDKIAFSPGNFISRWYVASFLMEFGEGQPESRGSGAALLLFAMLYAMGAVGFLYPEQMAFFGSRWQFKGEPELSDAGLFAAKAGSVVVMAAAVMLLFLGG